MTPIEKFIKDNYTPMIDEDKEGMKCVLKHRTNLTDNGVVYFHKFKKKKDDTQFYVVEERIEDIYVFLETYYNLIPEDRETVKQIIVEVSINKIKDYYNI
jgi:hypothetical protein